MVVVMPLHQLPVSAFTFRYALQGERSPSKAEIMKKIICSDKLIFIYHFPVLRFVFCFFTEDLFSIYFSVSPLIQAHIALSSLLVKFVICSIWEISCVEFYFVRMIVGTVHSYPKLLLFCTPSQFCHSLSKHFYFFFCDYLFKFSLRQIQLCIF